jgi:paraquat-inducible protein B
VGAFVLGALFLVLAAVVLLSTGGWFESKRKFTVFFPGSVRGLNQGAPVTFRGVKIGEVKDVSAFLTGKDDQPVQIEVVIEVRTDLVEAPPGQPRPFSGMSSETFAKELLQRGVRARLLSGSLLTGQKYIELDFLPREPARFVGLGRRHPELPSTPTAMEKLGDRAEDVFEKLAELPLDQMLEDLRTSLQSLREVLDSPDLKGAMAGTRRSTEALEPALKDAREAIADARALVKQIDGQAQGISTDARRTMEEARQALEQSRRSMERLNNAVAGAEDTRVTAAETLEQLSQTLKALRNLVDYIQTHPESVVLGKPKREEEKR